jgi:hypothetical protein
MGQCWGGVGVKPKLVVWTGPPFSSVVCYRAALSRGTIETVSPARQNKMEDKSKEYMLSCALARGGRTITILPVV